MMRSLRASENFHILLWLLKDLCWVMDLKVPGLVMILPTFTMAVWIAWRSRHDLGELLHCVAVVFWITANGTWMIGEFFFDNRTLPLAICFFGAGLLTLIPYYGYLLLRKATNAR